MTFSKQDAFTKKATDLPDKPSPQYTASEIKEHFQTPADELKTTVNNIVDKLNSTTDGNSGADNLGATSISGLEGMNVQLLMESMKGLVDSKTDNVGNHLGTWQGFNPTQVDQALTGRVNTHDGQIKDIQDNYQQHRLTTNLGRNISIDGQDLNLLMTNGFYNGINLKNAPTTEGYVEHYENQANGYAFQLFVSNTTGREVFQRHKQGGIWFAWDQVLTVGSTDYKNFKQSIVYEKGTWIPTLRGDTTAGTHTYSTREAEYIRFNNLIYLRGRISITTKGTIAGGLTITGLPYPTGTGGYRVATIGLSSYVTYPTASRGMFGFVNGNTFSPYFTISGGNFTKVQATDILDGFNIVFSAVYDID